MPSVNELIEAHEADARLFRKSGESLRNASAGPAEVAAAFAIAQQHQDLADMLRGEKQDRRELRTNEGMRRRGRV